MGQKERLFRSSIAPNQRIRVIIVGIDDGGRQQVRRATA